MHASLFKAYDIRGTYGTELDAAFARRLGKVLVALYRPTSVMVGRDMRTSSPILEEALIGGLIAAGVHVVKIGMCSTPMFNFALGSNGSYSLGVMVTASHNPGMYNGFKLAKGNCAPIGMGSGMEAIREACMSDTPYPEALTAGQISEDTTVLERYIDRVLELAHLPSPMPSMRVAIDAGNGMAGLILPKLCKKLPFLDVYPLYWDPDGSFPHHEANPLKVETLREVQELVVQRECVVGVAFDGDADRVGFVDEIGDPIQGDLLTALFAQAMLVEQPGGHVLYDLRSSKIVPEVITAAGGTAEMCKVGHASIKQKMRETGAIFAGELSMHFYFQQMFNCESTDLAFLLFLKQIAMQKKSASQLVQPLRKYVQSGEINFTVKKRDELFSFVRERFATQASDWSELDGLRGELGDWWFSLRSSNTEPLVRLNIEASTPQVLEEQLKAFRELIQTYA